MVDQIIMQTLNLSEYPLHHPKWIVLKFNTLLFHVDVETRKRKEESSIKIAKKYIHENSDSIYIHKPHRPLLLLSGRLFCILSIYDLSFSKQKVPLEIF